MDTTCRTCLKVSENLTSIFEDTLLSYKIEVISSVTVSVDDDLPSTICELCVRNVHLLYDFRNVIIASNATLLKRRAGLAQPNGEAMKCESDVFEGATDEYIKLDPGEFVDDDDEMPELEKPYVRKAIMKAEERKLSVKKSRECRRRENSAAKRPVPQSICNVCGVTIRSDNLNKHILIHIEDPINCTICGKTCKNTESLRSHMIMHRGITYACKICTKVYKHRGGLIAHRKRHAAGGAKTVPCSICGKLFYDKQVLQKHIRSHTGERPYPCKYCNKGFSSIYARNTHTRQHTNERPYACQFCGAAFHQKVSLKTHFQSKHPAEVDALSSL